MRAKITQEIIDKLGLKYTGEQCGKSFMYGTKVYNMPRFGENVYLMECDIEGNPLENRTFTLLFKKNGWTCTAQITPEFIECVDINILNQAIQAILIK